MIGYETTPYKPPVTYMHNSVSDFHCTDDCFIYILRFLIFLPPSDQFASF